MDAAIEGPDPPPRQDAPPENLSPNPNEPEAASPNMFEVLPMEEHDDEMQQQPRRPERNPPPPAQADLTPDEAAPSPHPTQPAPPDASPPTSPSYYDLPENEHALHDARIQPPRLTQAQKRRLANFRNGSGHTQRRGLSKMLTPQPAHQARPQAPRESSQDRQANSPPGNAAPRDT
jgi:hypothetical protein